LETSRKSSAALRNVAVLASWRHFIVPEVRRFFTFGGYDLSHDH